MRRFFGTPCVSIMFLASLSLSSASHAENWKGNTQTSPIELGAMGGIAMYANTVHWGLLGSAAYLVLPQGWIDDVDDRVWAEIELGPTFFTSGASSQTGLQYSAHLRWDFTYNQDWTFYALGGLGGFYLPTILGKSFVVNPRVALGAEFQTKLPMMFRMEVSHEFVGAGVVFNF